MGGIVNDCSSVGDQNECSSKHGVFFYVIAYCVIIAFVL